MSKKTKTKWFAIVLLGGWFCGMSYVGACLMVGHWIALPHPTTDNHVWAQKISETRNENTEQEWTAFHFIYGDCPCSRRVLRKIMESNPQTNVFERVVLIGGAPELARQAEQRGYEVDVVTLEQLVQKYGLESAPLLVVLDPDGQPCYAGGYTSRKQGLDVRHIEIISQLVAGNDYESLPLYGCAVSDSLKAIVDPLGLKNN